MSLSQEQKWLILWVWELWDFETRDITQAKGEEDKKKWSSERLLTCWGFEWLIGWRSVSAACNKGCREQEGAWFILSFQIEKLKIIAKQRVWMVTCTWAFCFVCVIQPLSAWVTKCNSKDLHSQVFFSHTAFLAWACSSKEVWKTKQLVVTGKGEKDSLFTIQDIKTQLLHNNTWAVTETWCSGDCVWSNFFLHMGNKLQLTICTLKFVVVTRGCLHSSAKAKRCVNGFINQLVVTGTGGEMHSWRQTMQLGCATCQWWKAIWQSPQKDVGSWDEPELEKIWNKQARHTWTSHWPQKQLMSMSKRARAECTGTQETLLANSWWLACSKWLGTCRFDFKLTKRSIWTPLEPVLNQHSLRCNNVAKHF